MIPLRDANPTRTPPILTVALIAVCVAIYFFVQPSDAREDLTFTFQNAAIPCEVLNNRPLTREEFDDTLHRGDATACDATPDGPPEFPQKSPLLAILYSMFLHGSLLHLGGNMLFLWIFGNNIEDTRGRIQYLLFYLAAGLVATVAHIAIQPRSTVPVIGASGAIAGVMGAYLVLFPDAPIRTLIIFGFIFVRDITAKWLLGIWFVSQFFISPGDGVAWMAHVGGFVFGAVIALFWRNRRRDRGPRSEPLLQY